MDLILCQGIYRLSISTVITLWNGGGGNSITLSGKIQVDKHETTFFT